MNSSMPMPVSAGRVNPWPDGPGVSPWPDGPDRKLGLFPIVTVGLSTKDRSVGCAINSVADADLSPAMRAEVAAELETLARHFRGPATPGPGA